MLAVSENTVIRITQDLPLSDPIWAQRIEILKRIIPPTDCVYELVRWYNGTPRFVRAYNALLNISPRLAKPTTDLMTNTYQSVDHKCQPGLLPPGSELFLLLHLKTVRPALLCLPELILPSFPMEDYLTILGVVGGANILSKTARSLPDRAANWGGINWRILEGLTISATAPPRLVRVPEPHPVCKPYSD